MNKYLWLLGLVWIAQGFPTIDKLVAHLNTLTEAQAKSAKIVVSVGFGGRNSHDPYYLIWPQETTSKK